MNQNDEDLKRNTKRPLRLRRRKLNEGDEDAYFPKSYYRTSFSTLN